MLFCEELRLQLRDLGLKQGHGKGVDLVPLGW